MSKKHILKVATEHMLGTIGVLTLALFLYFIVQDIQNKKNESILSSKENIRRLSQIVSSNVEMSFISVDQTLQRATERQYFNMLFGKTLSSDMEHNISMWVNKTPNVSAMFFTDEKGVVDVFFKKGESQFRVRPGYKFSSEAHFIKHRDNSDIELLISRLGDEDNNRVFVSRRIENINGNFGGLVVAVLDGNYITNLFSSMQWGKKTQMMVYLGDSELIVKADDLADGTNVFKSIKSDFSKEPSENIVVMDKYINNELMLFSKQNLNNLPISISLAFGEDDILKNWYQSRNQYIIFTSIFAAFLFTVVFFILLISKKMKDAKTSEQKALIASQTKSDFLAKMSHELRTPLNAIIGFSDMLATGYFGKVTQTQNERLKDINMCGNHLLEFINDILDFSKADAGKLKLREEVVDLYEVVSKSMRIIEQKAKANGITLINQIPRDVNSIFGDRRKIKQMILNLLSNAVKFTPIGGKITVSCDFDEEGNFIINVIDTGVGIDSKDIPKAMGVFEQVNISDDQSGTGLGLPLCKMFAQMHDGDFHLQSEVGVGTNAIITIPHSRIGKTIFEEQMVSVG